MSGVCVCVCVGGLGYEGVSAQTERHQIYLPAFYIPFTACLFVFANSVHQHVIDGF